MIYVSILIIILATKPYHKLILSIYHKIFLCIHRLNYFKTGVPPQCSVSTCGYIEHQHFSIFLVYLLELWIHVSWVLHCYRLNL